MSRLLVLLTLLLSGCSTYRSEEPTSAELTAIRQSQNVQPANYRADVISYMRNYLNDPTGVRNASISTPQVKDLPTGTRYIACMRYEARKGSGGYTGIRTALIVFVSGRLDRVIEPPPARERPEGEEVRQSGEVREACKDAAYGPFPELQTMTR